MLRRTVTVLGAVALGAVLWAAGPPAALAAPVAPDPACTIALPALPSAAGEWTGSLIAAGARLVEEGELDTAQRLYERSLSADTPDGRAGEGLVRVEAQRNAAATLADWGQQFDAEGNAEAAERCFTTAAELDVAQADAGTVTDDTTAPQADATRWSDFSAAWITPLGRQLVPVLAVLAVLVVVSRLITPLVVRTAGEAPDEAVRRSLWWCGLALMAVSALVVVVLGPHASGYGTGSRPWLVEVVVLLLLVAAVVLLGWAGLGSERWRAWTRRLDAVLIGVTVVVTGLLVATVARAWVTWSVAVLAGVVGVLAFAVGRGHALRLSVRVTKGKDDDPTSAAAVLARLYELGTAPPRGLRAPQQVDVTDLPETALKSLPTGPVASALTTVVGLFLPSVPWRAMIDDRGDGRLVIALTRNGRVAGTAVIDPARLWRRLPAADGNGTAPATTDQAELLTAAAAFVLAQLAQRHRRLQDGLCGATQWVSIAAQVVATGPGRTAEERRRLLAFALRRDPGNALALAAYAASLGENADTLPEIDEHIDRVRRVEESLLIQLGEPRADCPGHLPVHARVRHMLAASGLNAAVQTREDPIRHRRDWDRAVAAHASLVDVLSLDVDERSPVGEFIVAVRHVAGELYDAFGKLGQPPDTSDPDVRAKAWQSTTGPVPLDVLYDRACIAAISPDPARHDDALRYLRLAVGDEGLRAQARRDPWLSGLRDPGADPERRKTIWRLLGTAAEREFTNLPPFGEQGPALRAWGLATPEDLLDATDGPGDRRGVAWRLRVPRAVVLGWRAFAQLAVARELDTRALALLAGVGIRSVSALEQPRTEDELQTLFAELTAAAEAAGMRPPDAAEFEEWTGCPLPAEPVRGAQALA